MATLSPLETVQKKIDVLEAKILKTEEALDATQSTTQTDFQHKQLEQLNRQLSSLREQETILLPGRVSGEHSLPCYMFPPLG